MSGFWKLGIPECHKCRNCYCILCHFCIMWKMIVYILVFLSISVYTALSFF